MINFSNRTCAAGDQRMVFIQNLLKFAKTDCVCMTIHVLKLFPTSFELRCCNAFLAAAHTTITN
jgi:hypothetical protein